MKKLFRSQFLVTSNAQHDVFEDAFLAIDNDRIVGVGHWKDRPQSKSFRLVDARHAMITPGLFNLHAHLAMSLLKGVAEDVPLETWLNQFIFPLERKLVSPSFVRLGTELALCESIRAGITYTADMYFHPDQVFQAFDQSGLRGCIGVSFFDQGGMDTPSLEKSFELAQKFSKKVARHPRLQMALAPHAPYTCSPQTLKKAAQLAKDLHCGVMIHVAETQKEFHDLKRQTGKSPVQLVADSGLLQSKFALLAHMIWLDSSDYLIVDKANITSVLNLQCNAKLASGYPKIGRFRNSRARFCFGTDGSASNNSLDIFSELNFASKMHHLQESDLQGLPGPELFDAVTRRAAEAVGLEKDLGSLEVGKKADFLILNLESPHLSPSLNPYALLIYGVRASDVESVFVDGKPIMLSRKIKTLKEKEILKKASQFRKTQLSQPISGSA